VIAISIFSIGNLACGFSRNLEELIIFRVLAGLGGGGINVLVLIIISDISSLKKRGKVYSELFYLIVDASFCWCWSCVGRSYRTFTRWCFHRESHCIFLWDRFNSSGDGCFGSLFLFPDYLLFRSFSSYL
jgi:Sugar (and other) transporter